MWIHIYIYSVIYILQEIHMYAHIFTFNILFIFRYLLIHSCFEMYVCICVYVHIHVYVLLCVDLALAAIAFVLPSSKWDNPQLMSTMCHILDCAGLGSSTLKLSGTYNTSNGHVQWTVQPDGRWQWRKELGQPWGLIFCRYFWILVFGPQSYPRMLTLKGMGGLATKQFLFSDNSIVATRPYLPAKALAKPQWSLPWKLLAAWWLTSWWLTVINLLMLQTILINILSHGGFPDMEVSSNHWP